MSFILAWILKEWKGVVAGAGATLLLMAIPVTMLYSANQVLSGKVSKLKSKVDASEIDKEKLYRQLTDERGKHIETAALLSLSQQQVRRHIDAIRAQAEAHAAAMAQLEAEFEERSAAEREEDERVAAEIGAQADCTSQVSALARALKEKFQ